MSGHNKWSTIKHKKGAKDAKRGKLFSKITKLIMVAVKEGGPDESANPKLRLAIQKAKEASMPNDNIKRAIQRATGGTDSDNYTEIIYEGYGPNGVAMIVQCLTDNKNRTAASVRHIFSKYGGNLGETGCVGWMFDRKGYITVKKDAIDEDKLLEIILEAGADDLKSEDKDVYEIYCAPETFEDVKKALDEAGVKYEHASITMIPQNYVKLEGDAAKRMLKLMDALEEDDDVQEVYANFDIEESVMENMN